MLPVPVLGDDYMARNVESTEPEELPSDWIVAGFDYGLATAWLQHPDYEDVGFDVSVWDLPEAMTTRADLKAHEHDPSTSPMWGSRGLGGCASTGRTSSTVRRGPTTSASTSTP